MCKPMEKNSNPNNYTVVIVLFVICVPLDKGEININQWFFVVFRVRNPHVLLIEKPKNRVT